MRGFVILSLGMLVAGVGCETAGKKGCGASSCGCGCAPTHAGAPMIFEDGGQVPVSRSITAPTGGSAKSATASRWQPPLQGLPQRTN